MRAITVSTLTLLLAGIAATHANSTGDSAFATFKSQYNKHYRSKAQETFRRKVFDANMAEARRLQAANPYASFGANEFADLTPEEFKSHHGAEVFFEDALKEAEDLPKVRASKTAAARAAAPSAKIDWRQLGAVTPVKNQGSCGSCWAFGANGGIEAQWFLAGNPLVSLSEQELVSCDNTNSACRGGWYSRSYNWIMENRRGRLVRSADYPYVSGNGVVPECWQNTSALPLGARITGYSVIEPEEDAMAAWILENGPLPIAIDAGSWSSYAGGIITNCFGLKINHAVVIVGFDNDYEIPYWIIKNSWGAAWGEDGYLRVQKGQTQCLLGMYAFSPTVTSVGPTPLPGPTIHPEPTPPATLPTPVTPAPAQGWFNLLQLGVNGLAPPTLFDISCVSKDSCLITGGVAKVKFNIFNFSGAYDGSFSPVHFPPNYDAPWGGDTAQFIVAVGGTAQNPRGVAAGLDDGQPLWHLSGSNQFVDAATTAPLLATTASADKATGKQVLLSNLREGPHGLWFTKDGGETFVAVNATIPLKNAGCGIISNVEVVDAKVWYVMLTLEGAEVSLPTGVTSPPVAPSASSIGEEGPTAAADDTVLRWHNAHVAVVRDGQDGSIRHQVVGAGHRPHVVPKPGKCVAFDTAIAKTVDGGATWSTVLEIDRSNFTFGDLSCADANVCLAVGSAIGTHSTLPGSRVYHTTDGGKTWGVVLTNATEGIVLTNVRFVPDGARPRTAWVVGTNTATNHSVFYQSTDGGHTFKLTQSMEYIAAITGLSAATDGSLFATAIVSIGRTTATVLKYSPIGPALTPAPVTPGNISVAFCEDSGSCDEPCITRPVRQDKCTVFPFGDVPSTVLCDPTDGVVVVRTYDTNDCSGQPNSTRLLPQGECVRSPGGSMRFTCP